MLDKYLYGVTKRISPEAPVPVVNIAKESSFLGGAGNLAANLAAAGDDVILAGSLGSGKEGRLLTKMLRNAHIEFINLNPDCGTIVKTRVVNQNSTQICRIDYESNQSLPTQKTQEALQKLSEVMSRIDCLVFSDYAKGLLTRELVEPLIALAKQSTPCIPVFVDGKKDPSLFKGAFLIKPNFQEMAEWAGVALNSDGDLFREMNSLSHRLGINHVVCTLGSRGAACLTKKGGIIYPCQTRSVYDLAGAGDTFLAYLVSEYCRTNCLSKALVMANAAAGIAISKTGTAVVTRQEIGVNQKPDLEAARKGKTVVFTNGCFDIIHPGHLKLLSEAKRFGDILVIGLNSDASVRRLKGTARPINPFESRKAVLESLSLVDYVIGFDENTPLNLIKSLKPDVLVKGGDYHPNDIVGHDFVLSYGGKVEIVPLLKGFSSTDIINAIKSGKNH